MTDYIHRIYQADGTYIDRPYTEEEIEQAVKDKEDADAKIQANIEFEAKKAAAQAKLAALGLTADDLKALGLGGN